MGLPRQPSRVGTFDEKRNTSRVFQPEHGAVGVALKALQHFARENPRHAAWIASGAPSIDSEDKHFEVFGEPYAKRK